MKNKFELIKKYSLLFGVIGVFFYILHLIVGHIFNPDYNAVKQAISDLTADAAKGVTITRTLTTIYGIFIVFYAIAVFILFNEKSKLLRFAALSLLISTSVSLVGYGLFPIASEEAITSFQNIMHIVVTAVVVLTTISTFVLFGIAFMKNKDTKIFAIFTLACLASMFFGSMLMGAGSKDAFGIYERMNIFAVELWYVTSALYFAFSKSINKKVTT